MNEAVMLGFLDEMSQIVKTANQYPAAQPPYPPQEERPHLQEDKPAYMRALQAAKSFGGDVAAQALPAAAIDMLMAGRNPVHDMTALGEKLRHPSLFKGHIAEGARGMFLGPRSEPGYELLPEKGNRGPVNLAKHLWKTKGTRANQLLSLAMTANTAMNAKDLLNKEDPTGQGRSRLSRALEFGGTLGGGVLGATSGALGGTLMSMAGGAAGRGLGTLVDHVRGYSPTPESYRNITPVRNMAYSSTYRPSPVVQAQPAQNASAPPTNVTGQ